MRSSFCLIILLCYVICLTSCRPEKSFDIVIRGGDVLDGTGSQSIRADIGIRDGKIAAIGNLEGSESRQTLDATGMIVSPGFIDMHVHIENIMDHPDAASHVRQGVTTVLGGPDGGGPWPFGKYLDSLGTNFKLGMNIAYLTGHNVIRSEVMGNENRKPAEAELNRMKEMVRQAMEEGAFGLSTGLKYLPGAFAETSEIVELSRVAAGMGGIYTSHLREEGLGLLEGVSEAIVISRDAGIPVILTHHKAMGKPMWGKSVRTLAMVDSARKAGLDIMMDQYPYTASQTGISILIPAWAMAGGNAEIKRRLENKTLRDCVLKGIEFNILNDRGGGDARLVQLGTVEWDTTLNGKTLYDYAIRSKVPPDPGNCAKLVLDIYLKGGASCIFHAMDEGDVERIMKHPFTMIASDGGTGFPHPRAYGTFPRVLGHYVRDKGLITLEDAVRKMTSLPAARLGLADRGIIREGSAADITVFDPARIIDKSTYVKSEQYPQGIEYVLVNGVITADRNGMTGNYAGQVLRGPAYKEKVN